MSANKSFIFDRYLLRPANRGDQELAATWTAADPDHAGVTPANYWLEQLPNRCDSFLLIDPKGPIFFARLSIEPARTIRLDIQFMPAASHEERARLRDAMIRGLEWLTLRLVGCGMRELFFDSRNKTLIRFCVTQLGFIQEGERLRKMLA